MSITNTTKSYVLSAGLPSGSAAGQSVKSGVPIERAMRGLNMHRYYNKGAVFERRIIHDLISMGALLAIRGAGSKSFGSIKADIMALFPSGYLVIIQAKNSSSKFKKEHEEFIAHKGIQDRRIIWLWATPEHYKEDLKAIEKAVK